MMGIFPVPEGTGQGFVALVGQQFRKSDMKVPPCAESLSCSSYDDGFDSVVFAEKLVC